MAEEAGVFEEVIEGAGTGDEGQSTETQTQETQQTTPLTPAQKREEDKAYREWIKNLREDGESAKFARRAKDDYGRLEAIQRLEAKGYEGIKEKYDLLNGLAYGDKQGVEALSTMQESLAQNRAVLDAITSGNPEAFTSLDEDQQMGVARLTPAILDHLAAKVPDAYAAAMLPHFMDAIKGSELASAYSGLVNTLNQKPPTWMTPDQKTAWVEDKINAITQHATTMSQWFKAQDDRLKTLGGTQTQQTQQQQSTGPTEATKTYFKENIYPQTDKHVQDQFTELLKPWEARLAKAGIRLSNEKKQALLKEFNGDVTSKAAANAEYKRQMLLYNKMTRPDVGSVVSTFKGEFNKHATKSLESLVRRDYGQVLEKRSPAKAAPVPGRAAAVPQGVSIVTMKPAPGSYDPTRRTVDMIYKNQYLLKNGKVVEFRP